MKLLIVRADLHSQAETLFAVRAYADLLQGLFDRTVGVHVGGAASPRGDLVPFPVVAESEAQTLAAASRFALVLSCTSPDKYRRYPEAVNIGLSGWETDRWPPSAWIALVNQMDGLWVPTTHARTAFARAGVIVPMGLIPCPLAMTASPAGALPHGEIYNLDLAPRGSHVLARLCRFKGNRYRFSRALMRRVGPRAANHLLSSWRIGRRQLGDLSQTGLLCFAGEGERSGLSMLVAEWLEFKRKTPAASWKLLLQTGAAGSPARAADFVLATWEHVQALKTHLGVPRADIFLHVGTLDATDRNRLLEHVHGYVDLSLGRCFSGQAATRALALGKPVVAGRHTAFADCVPTDYPYTFATRPTHLRFVNDPLPGAHDRAWRWYLPASFAVVEALSRLSTHSPEQRQAVGRRASAYLQDWCRPAKVRDLLAEELQRLDIALARQRMDTTEGQSSVSRGAPQVTISIDSRQQQVAQPWSDHRDFPSTPKR